MTKDEILEGAANSNKKFLQTVSLDHLIKSDNKEISEDEAMVKASDCDIFYEKYFSETLDTFLLEELKYLGSDAQNDYMLLFCRGHIDMIDKLKNWFILQKSLSLSRIDKEREQEGIL
jgi:hypothetical protein